MGIQNLLKNLHKLGLCSEYKENLPFIDYSNIYIDFSSVFSEYFYTSKSEADLEERLNKWFLKLKGEKINLYIDKGEIIQKQSEREKRKSYSKKYETITLNRIKTKLENYLRTDGVIELCDKFNEIVNKIDEIDIIDEFNGTNSFSIEDYDMLTAKLFQIKNSKNISKILLNNVLKLKDLYNEKINIINCYNIDAEYKMGFDIIKFYLKENKVPIAISSDQDLIALLMLNINSNFIIKDKLFINNVLSKNVTLLTSVLNKSDFFPGVANLSITLDTYSNEKICEFCKFFSQEFDNLYDMLIIYIKNFKKVKSKISNSDDGKDINSIFTYFSKLEVYLYPDENLTFYKKNHVIEQFSFNDLFKNEQL
jgi:hypothetical protein